MPVSEDSVATQSHSMVQKVPRVQRVQKVLFNRFSGFDGFGSLNQSRMSLNLPNQLNRTP